MQIQRPNHIDTTKRNPVEYIYLKGDESTDGSLRLEANTAGDDFDISTRVAGVWISTSNNTLYHRYINGVGLLNDGGLFTDNLDGTVDIAEVVAAIRSADTEIAPLNTYTIAATTSLALTDNTSNYIYAEYNGGSPQIVASTTKRIYNHTDVLVAVVLREGTTLHIDETQADYIGDFHYHVIERFDQTEGFTHATGASLSETGTRNFAISAGTFWRKLNWLQTSAVDTSVADTFSYWYEDGVGGWTEVTAQTQIDNLQYDDGTGTLATLGNNKYGVHWIYGETDNDLMVLYGKDSYALPDALIAQPPSSLPDSLVHHGILVGKIIIQKSAVVFDTIQSAFVVPFTTSGVTSHLDLTDIGTLTHAQIDTALTGLTATPAELNLLDLSGLTIGWVLSADSATTASWKAPTGGGASPLTTKGDIFTFTTVDARLPVSGNDGWVLAEDSAEASGLKWVALAGGGDMLLGTSQVVTALKTFNDTTFALNNVAGTFNGSFVNTNTANRIYTLQDAAGTVAFLTDIPVTGVDFDPVGTDNSDNNAVNTLYSGLVSNVSTTLSIGTVTATTFGITSDGSADDVVLPEANTTEAGLLGADKWNEIVANTLKTSNIVQTTIVGITGTKAEFDTAVTDGDILYVGDVTTFPGWGSVTDHTDIVSATNTDKFALMANGTTGYVGRALVEADISDLGTYSTDIHGNIAALDLVSGTNTGDQIIPVTGVDFDPVGTDNSDDNAVNTLYSGLVSNVSTTLSIGTITATTFGITSDGGADDVILPEANTTQAGLLGADKWNEIVANSLKVSNITQTTIVGITGTKAQFDTAVTDGDFMYIGDTPTAHTHLLAAGATDVTATAAEVNLLDLSGLTAGWVLSADTATTASWKAPASGGSANLFDASKSSTQALTATMADITAWSASTEEDSAYTWDNTNGILTIDETGRYLISANIGFILASGTRSHIAAVMQLDPLGVGAYADVAGTYTVGYGRELNQMGSTGSFSKVISLTATDKLKLQAEELSGAGELGDTPTASINWSVIKLD